MSDFLAKFLVSLAYNGILAVKKAVAPVRIIAEAPGKLEKKLKAKLKKDGW